MRLSLFLSALVIALLAVGCDRETNRHAEEAPPDTVDTSDSDAGDAPTEDEARERIDELIEAGRRLGTTESEIRERFGEPQDAVRADTINPHTGDRDEVIRLRYAEADFELYRAVDDDRELLMETTLRAGETPRSIPFEMGVERAAIEARLGPPDEVSDGAEDTILFYETRGIGAPNRVAFHLDGGGLRQIVWHFYVD